MKGQICPSILLSSVLVSKTRTSGKLTTQDTCAATCGKQMPARAVSAPDQHPLMPPSVLDPQTRASPDFPAYPSFCLWIGRGEQLSLL